MNAPDFNNINNLDLVNIARCLILSINEKGIITFVNEQCTNFFKFEENELLHKSVIGTIIPENNYKIIDFQKLINQVTKEPDKYKSIEIEHTKKTGEKVTIAWSNKFLFSQNKKINGVISVGFDMTEKSQIKKELEKSQERLNLAMEATTDGIWDIDYKNNEYFVNPKFFEKFGYNLEKDEINIFNYKDIMDETEYKIADKKFQDALNNETNNIDFTYRIKDKQNITRWLHAQGKVIERDKKGKALRVVGTTTDITYRVKAEMELKESEERYHQIYNNIPIGILEYDYKGIITDCNDKFLALSGTRRSQIKGFDLSKPLSNKSLWEALIKPLSGIYGYYKGIFTPELGYDDMFVEADFAPIVDKEGIVKGGIGIIEDITEKHKAEVALHRSENEFRSLFENAHDAILIFTPFDEKVLNVNDRACEIYGFEKEELIGLSLKTITKNIEYGRMKIREVLENGKIQNIESIQYKKDGSLMYLEINASLIEYEGKQAILSINREVTDRKKQVIEIQNLLEEQKQAKTTIENYAKRLERMNNNLLKSEEQLANLVASKDKFLSIIAHDLKNPIKGFMNLTNILVESAYKMDREEILKHGLAMNSSAEHLFKLLDDLLSWSRLQSGIIDFKPKIQYVPDLVKKSLSIMTGAAKEKNIQLIHGEYFPYSVFVDVNMVDTILRNLVSNAIKFTKPGGRVYIVAREKDVNYIEVTVEDNGIGIPKSLQSNVFRIDKNLTNTGTSNEVGSGLGLILCKELINKNGGDIYFESESGKGSKFMITLPKANRI